MNIIVLQEVILLLKKLSEFNMKNLIEDMDLFLGIYIGFLSGILVSILVASMYRWIDTNNQVDKITFIVSLILCLLLGFILYIIIVRINKKNESTF